MDVTTLLIDATLREERGFTPNHHNPNISAPSQLTLSKMKTIDDRIFKTIKRLLDISGQFLKVKGNCY